MVERDFFLRSMLESVVVFLRPILELVLESVVVAFSAFKTRSASTIICGNSDEWICFSEKVETNSRSTRCNSATRLKTSQNDCKGSIKRKNRLDWTWTRKFSNYWSSQTRSSLQSRNGNSNLKANGSRLGFMGRGFTEPLYFWIKPKPSPSLTKLVVFCSVDTSSLRHST